MNYSRSTEDYRQLSVDYSDSNSISESTSLILSNRGHRRGKIFLKDYVYELWDYPCRSGDRCSHALLVTWLGRYSCAKLQRRKILLYLIPFYLCPTVKLYIPWLPCSSITSFFMPLLPGEPVQQITDKAWQQVSGTWGLEIDEKQRSYPTDAYDRQCQYDSTEISWIYE